MESNNSHILSFKYALQGIIRALRQEPNMKFHLFAAVLVLVLSFLLKISKQDLMVVFLLIGFVIAIELTNTAIEAVVDAFIMTHHPAAKLAKDISAGAVLVVALTSAIVGIIIFAPYILGL